MNEEDRKDWNENWYIEKLNEKEAIIDGISDALMVLDAEDFRILEVNQAFLNSYGTSREAVFGKSCYDITHQLNIPCHHANSQCPCPLEDTVSTGQASEAEHVHHDHEGKTLYSWRIGDDMGLAKKCVAQAPPL